MEKQGTVLKWDLNPQTGDGPELYHLSNSGFAVGAFRMDKTPFSITQISLKLLLASFDKAQFYHRWTGEGFGLLFVLLLNRLYFSGLEKSRKKSCEHRPPQGGHDVSQVAVRKPDPPLGRR